MTVSSATRKAGPYTGNDSTSSFDFDFKVFDEEDIRVVETLISTGVETDLTLNGSNGYTVTLNGDQSANPGGSITYKQGGVTTALPSTKKLTIVGGLETSQLTDITSGGGFDPEIIEDRFDYITILIQQLEEQMDRAVKVDVSSDSDPDDLIDQLDADVLAAAASAAAAAASESAAATSETNAAASEASAAASAVVAQAAADSIGFRDVVFITVANSPFTITSAHAGKLISVDTSDGAVSITLPQISSLTLPFTCGVKKATGDGNSVTINRAGSDTFDDGNTSKVLSAIGGTTLIPDTDTSPDKWTVAEFGAAAGQQLKQQFSNGVGFTAGTSTTVTLSETPLPTSKDALSIFFDTAYQQESEWSYDSGTGVVTFTSTIPGGVAKIQAQWTSPVAIGTPADGTVSTAKLASAAVTAEKLAYSSVNGQTAETAPATGDEVCLADVSASALRKMTLSNILKVLNSLTEDTSPDKGADFLLSYDTSASGVKKVKPGYVSGVVQVQYTSPIGATDGSTQTPLDNSIPQVGEGTQFMSVSITPKFSDSLIIVEGVVLVSNGGSSFPVVLHIHRDGASNAGYAMAYTPDTSATNIVDAIPFRYITTAGSVSATTFTLRMGPSGASTITFNGKSSGDIFSSAAKSVMSVSEVRAS